MTNDSELQDWRDEWQAATPPVPDAADLDRWMKKQRRRFALENVLAFAVFIAGLSVACVVLLGESSVELKVACAWIAILYAGGMAFTLWNQRGVWRPSARTTRAFVELSHRRALASLRAVRAARWSLIGIALVTGGIALWISFSRPAFALGMGVGFAASLVPLRGFLSRRRRRYQRDLEQAEQLLSQFEEATC